MSEHIGYLCSISIPGCHGYARRGDVATGNPGVNIACCATRDYAGLVIRTIRHKGLRRFYESGSTSGIRSAHTGRLRLQLAALDTAYTIQDMDIPGFKLHPLKGKLKGRWAIRVSGNWRLTFEFKDGDVYLLDYEDYY